MTQTICFLVNPLNEYVLGPVPLGHIENLFRKYAMCLSRGAHIHFSSPF